LSSGIYILSVSSEIGTGVSRVIKRWIIGFFLRWKFFSASHEPH
jgi:hypothetical protein